MNAGATHLEKQREIVFCVLHPDSKQAHSATALLQDLAGVLHVEAISDVQLSVRYNLLETCLVDIEALLEQHGFHLDNKLVHKIRRALHHYTEETQRANVGCARGDSNCTQKVFVNRYRKRDHGCQDDRPDPWRRYL